VIQVEVLESDAVLDISTATATAILFTKPSGEIIERAASFLTDGTDGLITYTTLESDLDQKGIWSYRGRVTFSATKVFPTVDPDFFTVVA